MVRKEDYVALAGFRSALRRFIHFVEEGAKSAGITPQQHQVLLAIAGQTGREWASIGEIADAMMLKHHAAVGLVDRCAHAGLVERHHDSEDRRVVRVTLTNHGAEVLESLTVRNLGELKALGSFAQELQRIAAASDSSERR